MTLPDHIADYLEQHPDGERLIVAAVHRRMAETMTSREMLEATGWRSTEASRAWMRDNPLRPLTDEQRTENQRRMELLRAGRWPEPQE